MRKQVVLFSYTIVFCWLISILWVVAHALVYHEPLSIPLVHAEQSPTVIISELYPAPTSGEAEWVEILNISSTPVVLTGWWLADELTSPSVIHQFDASEPPLQPGEFRQVLTSANKLNNTGDGVRLYRDDGVQQSRLAYSSSQTGQSQQRVSLEDETTVRTTPTPNADHPTYSLLTVTADPAAPVPSATPIPSGSPTPIPTPIATPKPSPSPTPAPTPTASPSPSSSPTTSSTQPSPDQITISEIMACPSDGQTEWVELYNRGSSLTAANWRITDQSGNFRTLSGILLGNSYTVLSWSGSLLNNTGDGFVITTDTNQVVSSASYTSCSSGKSLIAGSDSTWIAATPTPGAANPSAATETTASASTSVTTTAIDQSSDREQPTNLAASQVAAVALPGYDPRSLFSQPVPPQASDSAQSSSPSSSQGVTPSILGATDPTYSPGRPWWLLFVIMAGSLFALSGVVPSYARTS